MATFRDTEHLYRVMGALVSRLNREPEIAGKLLESRLVVRFICRDPEGMVTVDLTREPITARFGETELEPDVTFSLSGDTAHLFWLGRLNITRAIATRQVVARGSVPKALKLLPAIKPAYALYPEVLRELGDAHLIPVEVPPEARVRRLGLLERLRALVRRAPAAEIDYEALNRFLIPVLEEVPTEEVKFVVQALPTEQEALKVEMLRRMILIRSFEDRLAEEYRQGNLPSEALFLSTGQEATAVGACFALRPQDYIATTYRNIPHLLAKGADLKGVAAELFGKETGLCKGKGGVMHLADARLGALPGTGIVGASTLMGIGAALSARQSHTDQVALCFLGDGATNQGMFHEALNFAAVLNLPAIFVIENNLYGEFTPLSRASRVQQLSRRAAAYGVPGLTVDGNDVWTVYQATREAVERARNGGGPTLLECMTYRLRGHTEGEDFAYRTPAEVEEWRKKDPILRLRDDLLARGVLTEVDVAHFHEEAQRATEEALAFVRESPEPSPDSLTEDVYAPEPAQLYRATGPRVETRREISFGQALTEALAEEMARDERVFLIGEEVTTGGYFAVTAGLAERFGHERVIDTPISEYAIVGSAVSAAMTGTRPVAEIMFSDFLTCAMDPLINHAAKMRYLSGGQYRVPLVVRSPGGAGVGLGPQHSQSFEALLMGIPGLIIIAPGTPYDAKGLLKAAIRSNNPVLFFENKLLYASIGLVPEGEYLVPIGVADVKREGGDVTLVAVGAAVSLALDAAEQVTADGISVEVVDPRTLVPLDLATIVRSIMKTGRLVIAEPGHLTGGFGAELAARVSAVALPALKAPIERVASLDVPVPYNRKLENAATLTAERLAEAVRRVVG